MGAGAAISRPGPESVQPIVVTVGPVTPTLPTRPCQLYVDIRCDRGPEQAVRFLAFRNLYTAHITVKARLADEGNPPCSSSSPGSGSHVHQQQQRQTPAGLGSTPSQSWHEVLMCHRCMEDPHYEDDAQALHVVELPAESVHGVALRGVVALRIYLYQPSPRWAGRPIGVRHVAVFSSGSIKGIRAAMVSARAVQNKHAAVHGGWHEEEEAEMGMEWDDDEVSGDVGRPAGAPVGGPSPGSRAGSPLPGLGSGSPSWTGQMALDAFTLAGLLAASKDVRAALQAVSKARSGETGALNVSGGQKIRSRGGGGGGGRDDEDVDAERDALFGEVAPSAANDEILYAT